MLQSIFSLALDLQVRSFYEDHGISSVLVIGGSGSYFELADTVIMMDNYVPKVF